MPSKPYYIDPKSDFTSIFEHLNVESHSILGHLPAFLSGVYHEVLDLPDEFHTPMLRLLEVITSSCQSTEFAYLPTDMEIQKITRLTGEQFLAFRNHLQNHTERKKDGREVIVSLHDIYRELWWKEKLLDQYVSSKSRQAQASKRYRERQKRKKELADENEAEPVTAEMITQCWQYFRQPPIQVRPLSTQYQGVSYHARTDRSDVPIPMTVVGKLYPCLRPAQQPCEEISAPAPLHVRATENPDTVEVMRAQPEYQEFLSGRPTTPVENIEDFYIPRAQIIAAFFDDDEKLPENFDEEYCFMHSDPYYRSEAYLAKQKASFCPDQPAQAGGEFLTEQKTTESVAPPSPIPENTSEVEPAEKQDQDSDVYLWFPAIGGPRPITNTQVKTWKSSFPGIPIEIELQSALDWLEQHPKKKNITRFLHNWFSKSRRKLLLDQQASNSIMEKYTKYKPDSVSQDLWEQLLRLRGSWTQYKLDSLSVSNIASNLQQIFPKGNPDQAIMEMLTMPVRQPRDIRGVLDLHKAMALGKDKPWYELWSRFVRKIFPDPAYTNMAQAQESFHILEDWEHRYDVREILTRNIASSWKSLINPFDKNQNQPKRVGGHTKNGVTTMATKGLYRILKDPSLSIDEVHEVEYIIDFLSDEVLSTFHPFGFIDPRDLMKKAYEVVPEFGKNAKHIVTDHYRILAEETQESSRKTQQDVG